MSYLAPMVIYEDNHLLIVNKRPGELVQGDKTGDPTILEKYKAYIKKKYNKPGAVYLHPVHRLDRPVSGCLIFGRTTKALSRLGQVFKEGMVEKKYLALSNKLAPVSEGKLEDYIIKDKNKNISRIARPKDKEGKKCVLKFKLLASGRDKFLYDIRPLTGRSHQIRVQLANMGSPIIGDVKYKGLKIDDQEMIYLHCAQLSFMHPVRKELLTVACAPLKGEIWSYFDRSHYSNEHE